MKYLSKQKLLDVIDYIERAEDTKVWKIEERLDCAGLVYLKLNNNFFYCTDVRGVKYDKKKKS